jgi:hypothetical protein
MSEKEIKVLSAAGILGYGFPEESLNAGIKRNPDVIGCDAGSTDAGPYYLGEGTAFVSRTACKRDAELLIKAARKLNIPLLIGTAGGAGGIKNLEFLVDIVKEIAQENSLHFKLGVINTEINKDYLKGKLKQGRISTMGNLPELTEEEIDKSVHIVGLAGAEPFAMAVNNGADVVLCGRSSDTSIFASLPVEKGFDAGLAWHAAKILECGAVSAEPISAGDCVLVTIREDYFLVEPMNPVLRHTKVSTAAHALYENADPFHLYEAGGMLDLTEATYEQYDDRTVKVSKSKYIKADKYFIKIEAASKVGYRTISIMGTRDPILISQFNDYLKIVRKTVNERVADAFKGKVKENEDYRLNFHVYGLNAIMGENEPVKETQSHELGVVIEVVANTQELANSILAFARTYTLHNNFPGRLCIAGNMAIAFSPSDIPMGPVYRFNMEHLVEMDDPNEFADFKIIEL